MVGKPVLKYSLFSPLQQTVPIRDASSEIQLRDDVLPGVVLATSFEYNPVAGGVALPFLVFAVSDVRAQPLKTVRLERALTGDSQGGEEQESQEDKVANVHCCQQSSLPGYSRVWLASIPEHRRGEGTRSTDGKAGERMVSMGSLCGINSQRRDDKGAG